jgi:hypothetical protein
MNQNQPTAMLGDHSMQLKLLEGERYFYSRAVFP